MVQLISKVLKVNSDTEEHVRAMLAYKGAHARQLVEELSHVINREIPELEKRLLQIRQAKGQQVDVSDEHAPC